VTANHGDGPAASYSDLPFEPWPGPVAHPDHSRPADVDPAPSLASRIVTFVLGLLVGVVYGAVGTVAHPLAVSIGSISLPYGLVVGLVGVLALFVGFRLVVGGRLAAVGAAVGAVGIVSLFSLESIGGSILIREGLAGSVWLVGPALLGALVIAWPSLPTHAHRLEAPDVKEPHTP
jgi:hypothetical protein